MQTPSLSSTFGGLFTYSNVRLLDLFRIIHVSVHVIIVVVQGEILPLAALAGSALLEGKLGRHLFISVFLLKLILHLFDETPEHANLLITVGGEVEPEFLSEA